MGPHIDTLQECVCVSQCMCVCVYVCEIERKRQKAMLTIDVVRVVHIHG